jgi:flavorubredoxin
MPNTHELLGGDVTMFSTQAPELPLTFNQYLLATEEPVLVHTGAAVGADELAHQVSALVGDELRWIFASHFESDECGGVKTFVNRFPQATVVCSAVTSRQLLGFGITDRTLVKQPGDTLDLGGGRRLEFLPYPSEVHLWEGLLAFETDRGILFSSDLIMRMGGFEEALVPSSWSTEVDSIPAEKIPDPRTLAVVKEELLGHKVRLVAPGHGPALDVAGNPAA